MLFHVSGTAKIAISFYLKNILVLIFCLLTAFVNGQVNIHFEDSLSGQLMQFPASRWALSTQEAISGNSSLKHIYDNTDAGSDRLSLQHDLLLLDTMLASWEFKIKHGYNPSGSNNWAVFFAASADASEMDRNSKLDAYVLGVNFTGYTDSLCVWKMHNGSTNLLSNCGVNWQTEVGVGKAAMLTVNRNVNGEFNVYIDTSATFNQPRLVNQFTDNQIKSGSYMGVNYTYSSARDRALWVDDIAVNGYFYADTLPPQIVGAFFTDERRLNIQFNETVDINSLAAIKINGQVIVTDTIETIGTTAYLQLNKTFTNGQQLTIDYSGVKDLRGIAGNTSAFNLTYAVALANDIVITEVMADPSPPVALPNAEFVELFNLTNYTMYLYKWQLLVDDKIFIIDSAVISANDYLLVCNDKSINDFRQYGKVLGLFTANYTLTNDGSTICLKSVNGRAINQFQYTSDMYGTNINDGGRSLEIIDPFNQCNQSDNWTVSTDESGGTPGKINSVNHENIDISAPTLVTYGFLNDTLLKLEFNEPVFFSGSPNNLLLSTTDYSISEFTVIENGVWLYFNKAVFQGFVNNLSINDISDACGNTTNVNCNINYYKPNRFDVLITEVMADPLPAVELPQIEYIEIYNNTAYMLWLNNWLICANDKCSRFNTRLNANSYALLVNSADTGLFNNEINTVAVDNFPTLSNDEALLTLYNSSFEPVHTVSYFDNWYITEFKKEGGYSLEMVDINNPCTGNGNWLASTSQSGGTPGAENSVKAINPDNTSPAVVRIFPVSDMVVKIHFSEKILVDNLTKTYFTINDMPIEYFYENEEDKQELILYMSQPLYSDQLNKLAIQKGIIDCTGNAMEATTIYFQIPQSADSTDVIINELLFNPTPGGADFIELYNKSGKTLDLNELVVSNFRGDSLYNQFLCANKGYLFDNEEFIVLTTDSLVLKQQYNCAPGCIIQLKVLPTMPDDQGSLALSTYRGVVLDRLYYREDLHTRFIVNPEGVSIERLQYQVPSGNASNWSSAAESVGFATPGYVNSNFYLNNSNELFSVNSKVISPDGDGVFDELIVSYHFRESGHVFNAYIFTASGSLVKALHNNELAGRNGIIRWDATVNGYPADIGMYFIGIEYSSPSGESGIIKKPFVLVRKI